MDNFRGQTVTSVNALLEEHNIHVVFLPPNTTDMLQPMDVAVNKPAKDFLKRCFEQWYYEQIANQLAESDDLEDIEIQPVDLRLQTLKEWGAKWLWLTSFRTIPNSSLMDLSKQAY